ncbi:MAG: hypothetical protein MZW92_50945 [Comamonadaceae bacterium]|nr:hypothetical protein [Comamonadaceae bacterium]
MLRAEHGVYRLLERIPAFTAAAGGESPALRRRRRLPAARAGNGRTAARRQARSSGAAAAGRAGKRQPRLCPAPAHRSGRTGGDIEIVHPIALFERQLRERY